MQKIIMLFAFLLGVILACPKIPLASERNIDTAREVNVESSVDNAIFMAGPSLTFDSKGKNKNFIISVSPPLQSLDTLQSTPIFSPGEQWKLSSDVPYVISQQLYDEESLLERLKTLLGKKSASLRASIDLKDSPKDGMPIYRVSRQPKNSVRLGTVEFTGSPNMIREEAEKIATSFARLISGSNYLKVEQRNGVISKGASNGTGGSSGVGAPFNPATVNAGGILQDSVVASEAFLRPYVKVTAYSNNFHDESSLVGYVDKIEQPAEKKERVSTFEIFFSGSPKKLCEEQRAVLDRTTREILSRWNEDSLFIDLTGVSLDQDNMGQTEEMLTRIKKELRTELTSFGVPLQDILGRTTFKTIVAPNPQVKEIIKSKKSHTCIIVKVRSMP